MTCLQKKWKKFEDSGIEAEVEAIQKLLKTKDILPPINKMVRENIYFKNQIKQIEYEMTLHEHLAECGVSPRNTINYSDVVNALKTWGEFRLNMEQRIRNIDSKMKVSFHRILIPVVQEVYGIKDVTDKSRTTRYTQARGTVQQILEVRGFNHSTIAKILKRDRSTMYNTQLRAARWKRKDREYQRKLQLVLERCNEKVNKLYEKRT